MINNSDIDVQGRIDCIRDAISAAVPSTDAIEKLGTMRSDTTDQNSKQQLESDEAPNEPTHKDELRAVRGLESGRLVDGSRTEAEPNVDGAPKTNALIKAPEHWPLSQKETFKALPPATQQLLLDRNTALEKEHTRKMA